MTEEEKQNGVVGNIRIKEIKPKKKKKKNNESSPLWIKLLVWFMFIAMFASFIVPLIYYFISVINNGS